MAQLTQVAPDDTADSSPSVRRSRALTPLFTVTAFVGAGLLFVVQPMIARLLLPSYGGSATVWSTASLFFQVLLLLGYLYAHWTTAWWGRWQPRAHVLALLAPLVVLPLALPVDAVPEAGASPVLWLLRTLALVIGLPFVLVATTGPLLQKWYSWSGEHRSGDPYFLFAASNLGSFGGLLAYPFVVEPLLSLQSQLRWWSIAFVCYVVLTATCGLMAARRATAATMAPEVHGVAPPLTRARVGRWLAWAFLPSALMLAVTAHVSTDVAAVPLLWVLPLALYLATFVLAFARRTRSLPVRATQLAVALAITAPAASMLPGPGSSMVVEIGLQMALLGVVGYVAHARLAADRPHPAQLTTFYLVLAVGGALGGVLNGLLAPAIFDRVLEYPLVILMIPFLLAGVAVARDSWLDRLAERQVVWGLLLVGLVVGGLGYAFVGLRAGEGIPLLSWLAVMAVVFVIGFRLSDRTWFLVPVLVLLFGMPMLLKQAQSLDQGRSFFGSHVVTERGDQRFLVHGTTVHGTQFADERARQPTMYYARSGPLGAVMELREFEDVGVIGLGAGTIAAYGTPEMDLTYFEIDPDMVRVARDDRLFTFLSDSEADIDTLVGDGRLLVAAQPRASFDLLVLDAFSSDAIPVHLLTVEAMETYASRLRAGGLLAIHISNRAFDLSPVLAGAAHELGWAAVSGVGGSGEGATQSHWVVLAESQAQLAGLVESPGWEPLPADDDVVWTDGFSSILDVLGTG